MARARRRDAARARVGARRCSATLAGARPPTSRPGPDAARPLASAEAAVPPDHARRRRPGVEQLSPRGGSRRGRPDLPPRHVARDDPLRCRHRRKGQPDRRRRGARRWRASRASASGCRACIRRRCARSRRTRSASRRTPPSSCRRRRPRWASRSTSSAATRKRGSSTWASRTCCRRRASRGSSSTSAAGRRSSSSAAT